MVLTSEAVGKGWCGE